MMRICHRGRITTSAAQVVLVVDNSMEGSWLNDDL